jgi:hypothetical protein
MNYERREVRWRLLAIEQKTHIDVAVNDAEAAVGEAAKFIDFYQRRPKFRVEALGNARNVFADFVHRACRIDI